MMFECEQNATASVARLRRMLLRLVDYFALTAMDKLNQPCYIDVIDKF